MCKCPVSASRVLIIFILLYYIQFSDFHCIHRIVQPSPPSVCQQDLHIYLKTIQLSGLSAGLRTKGSLVRFPVRAHAWGCEPGPQSGACKRQPLFNVSLPPASHLATIKMLFVSMILSLFLFAQFVFQIQLLIDISLLSFYCLQF